MSKSWVQPEPPTEAIPRLRTDTSFLYAIPESREPYERLSARPASHARQSWLLKFALSSLLVALTLLSVALGLFAVLMIIAAVEIASGL